MDPMGKKPSILVVSVVFQVLHLEIEKFVPLTRFVVETEECCSPADGLHV